MRLDEVFDLREQTFLKKELPNFDFDVDYDDEKLIDFEDELQDVITLKGFDEFYNINTFGKKTEKLLDKYVDYIDRK
ncbi:hypothetical protein MUB24_03395 [Lederbergia sp. NSJ-179]|uniref:hypothetical protein n=1 Tax=Lederbergia sp. NSJ-179 TaxID=2931402 RepID=UPI001FD0235B|nr:hypothetical protein [Lederbergia sp. NSJ-179]MCJ7839972.1 hypothetical protein [Lederbergia sp. NSJ-179]